MSQTPFADPLWYTRRDSPYYNESHNRLRDAVRKYVDEHISPFCEEWEKNEMIPPEVGANVSDACDPLHTH